MISDSNEQLQQQLEYAIQVFIAYRSSKVSDCIFEIHQLIVTAGKFQKFNLTL